MMSDVFAPYCPSCDRRVLLGCEDIVRFTADGATRHVVVLRCSCGELVEWDQRPPEPAYPDEGPLASTPSARVFQNLSS